MGERTRPKVRELRRGLYVIESTRDRLNDYTERLKIRTGKRQLSQSKAIDYLLDLAEQADRVQA